MKPWIFKEVIDSCSWLPTTEERVQVLFRFVGYMKEYFGYGDILPAHKLVFAVLFFEEEEEEKEGKEFMRLPLVVFFAETMRKGGRSRSTFCRGTSAFSPATGRSRPKCWPASTLSTR